MSCATSSASSDLGQDFTRLTTATIETDSQWNGSFRGIVSATSTAGTGARSRHYARQASAKPKSLPLRDPLVRFRGPHQTPYPGERRTGWFGLWDVGS